MKISILLLTSLFIITSCGDKHTFDHPNPVDKYNHSSSSANQDPKDIVLITPHENPADYYNDEIHQKYLSKLSQSDTLQKQDFSNLKKDLNQILKWEHTRVKGKRDTSKRCPKNAPESNSCYSHNIDIYNSYKTSRKYLFGKIHLALSNSGKYALDTIYCQQIFESSDLSNPQYKIGVMQIPDHHTVNTEHIWPRSKFDEEKNTPYYNLKLADLHNLYPASTKANRDRANYPFSSMTEDSIVIQDISEYCHNSNAKVFTRNGTTYFEAPDEVKGDIARIMFYVATRYYNPNNPTAMNIDKEQETTLKKWHKLDPVSVAERERNNKIFSIQHNRNPFIDYPELVELIDDF